MHDHVDASSNEGGELVSPSVIIEDVHPSPVDQHASTSGSVQFHEVVSISPEVVPSGSTLMEIDGSQLPPRRSAREHVPRQYFGVEGLAHACVIPTDTDELALVDEALSSPSRDKWLAAMRDEMDSMAKNHVWELVDLPASHKSIGNKCKIKHKADGID